MIMACSLSFYTSPLPHRRATFPTDAVNLARAGPASALQERRTARSRASHCMPGTRWRGKSPARAKECAQPREQLHAGAQHALSTADLWACIKRSCATWKADITATIWAGHKRGPPHAACTTRGWSSNSSLADTAPLERGSGGGGKSRCNSQSVDARARSRASWPYSSAHAASLRSATSRGARLRAHRHQ